jgi:hypothetical protein
MTENEAVAITDDSAELIFIVKHKSGRAVVMNMDNNMEFRPDVFDSYENARSWVYHTLGLKKLHEFYEEQNVPV